MGRIGERSRKLKNVTVVGIADDCINYMKRHGIKYKTSMDEFKNGTVDMIFASHVLEHLFEQKRLEEIYEKSNCFIFTSTHEEGFPVVLLEALSYNLPIICTDHPKYREFLEGAAIYFRTEEELTDAIVELVVNAERYRMQSEASARVFRKFTLEEICRKWIEVHKHLLSRR